MTARNDRPADGRTKESPPEQATGRAASAAAWLRRGLAARRLGDRGAASLEFALAAMPSFLLLFGTLELGLVFVCMICLTNATQQLSRQVRTGQIVLPGYAATTGTGAQITLNNFKTALCASIPILPTATCVGQLRIDVRVQSSFTGTAAPNPVNAGAFTSAGFCFYSGMPGNVVTVRAYLLWPLLTPSLLNMMSNVSSMTPAGTSNGPYVLLSSGEAFKNEPNPNSANTGSGC